MTEIPLPEDIVEWMELERQYPEWNKTPQDVKDKLIHLASAFSGFEIFREEHYKDYILELSKDLYDSFTNGNSVKADKLNQKLNWIARLLYEETMGSGLNGLLPKS